MPNRETTPKRNETKERYDRWKVLALGGGLFVGLAFMSIADTPQTRNKTGFDRIGVVSVAQAVPLSITDELEQVRRSKQKQERALERLWNDPRWGMPGQAKYLMVASRETRKAIDDYGAWVKQLEGEQRALSD